jgi:hypothetical protein
MIYYIRIWKEAVMSFAENTTSFNQANLVAQPRLEEIPPGIKLTILQVHELAKFRTKFTK